MWAKGETHGGILCSGETNEDTSHSEAARVVLELNVEVSPDE